MMFVPAAPSGSVSYKVIHVHGLTANISVLACWRPPFRSKNAGLLYSNERHCTHAGGDGQEYRYHAHLPDVSIFHSHSLQLLRAHDPFGQVIRLDLEHASVAGRPVAIGVYFCRKIHLCKCAFAASASRLHFVRQCTSSLGHWEADNI